MITPPTVPGTHYLYDTLADNPDQGLDNASIYVITVDYQSYPHYVVTFKR